MLGIRAAAASIRRQPATLRRWERLGLIPPPERDLVSRARVYSDEDLRRLRRLVEREPADANGTMASDSADEASA